jgi:hypothetical protein
VHTKLTSRLGRRRARFFTLSAIVLAASLVGFPSFSAADAHGGGGQGPWTASLRVLNRTHLKLRLVDKTKTEMTEWVKNPQDVVPSGTNLDSTVRNTPQATGHGLFQLDTYAAYAPVDGQDVYAGMFVVMNGIECKTIHLQICLDYSRTQGSWGSTLNPSLFHNASLDVRWIYSDGNPDKYVSEFELSTGGRPGSNAGHGVPADLDSPTQVGPAPNGSWGWTQSIKNNTPYVLTRKWNWNSQGTTYYGSLPTSISPGGSVRYAFVNDVALHGPQSFVVFSATDPQRHNEYVGSVVAESQTDCEFGAKVPDIPVSCLTWNVASNSFGASSALEQPQSSLVIDAHSETSGLLPDILPVSLAAGTDVFMRQVPR